MERMRGGRRGRQRRENRKRRRRESGGRERKRREDRRRRRGGRSRKRRRRKYGGRERKRREDRRRRSRRRSRRRRRKRRRRRGRTTIKTEALEGRSAGQKGRHRPRPFPEVNCIQGCRRRRAFEQVSRTLRGGKTIRTRRRRGTADTMLVGPQRRRVTRAELGKDALGLTGK